MKRIALIADLHGNLPAVEALEQDLNARSVDEIWCLGDIVGKGPSSPDTFDWAMAHCSLILRGNWDEGVASRTFSRNDQFYYSQLGEKRMRILAELPLEHHAIISGKHLRLLHGRPTMPVLQATHEPEEELTWLFEPDYDIVGYADIHRPGLRSLRSAPKLLFSIGSVGNSLGLAMVQYAILQCEMGADPAPLDLNFILLPYDQERAARDAENVLGMPMREAYLQEIRTGIYGRKPPLSKGKTE